MPSAAPASASAASTTSVAAAIGSATAGEPACAAQLRGEQQRDGDRAERRLPLGFAQEARVDRVELGLDRDDANARDVGDRRADAIDVETAVVARLQVDERAPGPRRVAGQEQRVERGGERRAGERGAPERRLRACRLDVGDERREPRRRQRAVGGRFGEACGEGRGIGQRGKAARLRRSPTAAAAPASRSPAARRQRRAGRGARRSPRRLRARPARCAPATATRAPASAAPTSARSVASRARSDADTGLSEESSPRHGDGVTTSATSDASASGDERRVAPSAAGSPRRS